MKVINWFKIQILKVRKCQFQAAHGGLQPEYNRTHFDRQIAWGTIDYIDRRIKDLR